MMSSSPSTYALKPALRAPAASTPPPSSQDSRFRKPDAEFDAPMATSETQMHAPQMHHVVSQRANAWFFHDVARISRFFSANKYTCFVQDGIEHIATESLSSLERRLCALGFMRTHRADLINLAHVRVVRRVHHSFEVTLVDGQTVQASRRLVRALRQRLAF